jgi:beta-galactosidase/beta-glucuronidase
LLRPQFNAQLENSIGAQRLVMLVNNVIEEIRTFELMHDTYADDEKFAEYNKISDAIYYIVDAYAQLAGLYFDGETYHKRPRLTKKFVMDCLKL